MGEFADWAQYLSIVQRFEGARKVDNDMTEFGDLEAMMVFRVQGADMRLLRVKNTDVNYRKF